MTLLLAIPIGMLIGLSLGALGGGGSLLTVPALVYLLGQSAHQATTGSLLIVGITAATGALGHHRSGRVLAGPGLVFGLLGVAGAYAGARLSATVDQNVLLAGFAALVLVVAGLMTARQRRSGGRPVPPADPPAVPAGRGGTATLTAPVPTVRQRHPVKVVAVASAVGLLTGFFGVGGGFVVVPALTLALGMEMPLAVGTSLLVIAVNSVVALAFRLGAHPHLDLPLLAVFTAAAIGGSLAGTRVAARARPERLNSAFTLLLVVVAGYVTARSIPHLW